MKRTSLQKGTKNTTQRPVDGKPHTQPKGTSGQENNN